MSLLGKFKTILLTNNSCPQEELVKRKRVDTQQPVVVRRVSGRLQAMASQVKEVLPHVPMATIISDLGIFNIHSIFLFSDIQYNYFIYIFFFLGRTDSINATVANLVEGVVPFTPEPVAVTAPAPIARPTGPLTSVSQAPSQFSASSFGKSMQERGLSLQERKQRLLQEARHRYCDKHGLQLVGINC